MIKSLKMFLTTFKMYSGGQGEIRNVFVLRTVKAFYITSKSFYDFKICSANLLRELPQCEYLRNKFPHIIFRQFNLIYFAFIQIRNRLEYLTCLHIKTYRKPRTKWIFLQEMNLASGKLRNQQKDF